ncbi:hypothetical protein L204_105815 [Cryptococcus depauperatus]
MTDGGASNRSGNDNSEEHSNAMARGVVTDDEPTKESRSRLGGILIPSPSDPSRFIPLDEPSEMGQSRTHQASIPEGSRGNWTAYSNLESGAYNENGKPVLTYRNNPKAHKYLVSVTRSANRKVELQFPRHARHLTTGENFLTMVTGDNGGPLGESLVPWEEHLDVKETRRLLLELHGHLIRSHKALGQERWKDAECRERAA